MADHGYCPRFHRAVELIGRRWTGVILLVMHGGATRFSEIRDSIPGLSDRMLSERLRELEAAGIASRRVWPDEIPPSVRYELTGRGRELAPMIEALMSWAERHVELPVDAPG